MVERAVRWANHHVTVAVVVFFVLGTLIMWTYKPLLHAVLDMVAATLAGAVVDLAVFKKEKDAGEVD